MAIEAWFTALVIVVMLAVLSYSRASPDVVFMFAVIVLLAGGVIHSQQAFAGFANEGVITVGALYVVIAGLRETGGVQWLAHGLLGRPRSLSIAQLRLTVPVALMSAVLNNTPVVGMLIPAVSIWARKFKLPVSRLMMPLSFAAILGGTITVIGTSTNLVINGLLIEQFGSGLQLFELAWVGLPVACVGILFMLIAGRWLFPDRKPAIGDTEDPRQYTLEMLVDPKGPLVGCSIEEAGLRHLSGGFLMEIDRAGTRLPAVAPQELLCANDRLIFVGVVESMVDLQKLRGLLPATDQVFKLQGHRADRCLLEVVVSNTCPLIAQTIRDGQFRNRYNAVVIAVARNGERIREKIGDICLRPGDTLLVEAGPSFLAQHRNRRDFFLMTQIEGSATPRHERAVLALSILFGMIASATLGIVSMLEAALLAAGLMLITRCVTLEVARHSIDWPVLFTIAAAFGIGAAMESTGLAQVLAHALTALAGEQLWLQLAMVYVATALFTAIITNNAAAVLMFPIACSMAMEAGVNVLPFVVVIMFAASASFATPFGYQTNLMVYGPGGYRFSDYLRAGIPMNLLTGLIALLLIPGIWPL